MDKASLQKPKQKFFGNQWTSVVYLPYRRDQRSIELCLRTIFCGFISKDRNGYRLSFNDHADYLKDWFCRTFNLWMSKAGPNSRAGKYYFGAARDFVNGARLDGWEFGAKNWKIPDWALQQYPRLVLQHWTGLKVSFFLFVTRRGNEFRTALTVKQNNIHLPGLQQIAHLLSLYDVQYSLKRRVVDYDYKFFNRMKKGKKKTIYSLEIYQIQNTKRLFDAIGWDQEIYQNRRIKAIQIYINRYLGDEISRKKPLTSL